jgi:Ca2+-binding RTX toxin-like protein
MLTIEGSDSAADVVMVDLGAGGGFSLLDGIVFDGKGGGKVDKLTIRGTPADNAFALGADQVIVDGLRVQYRGVEVLTLDGGPGNDAYQISSLVTQVIINDSSGTDLLDFLQAPVGVNVDMSRTTGQAQRVFSGAGNTLALRGTLENVVGSAFADCIRGNSAANRIWGGAGNDTLYGGSGDDWLYGEDGDDRLYGGDGIDILLGGTGNDLLDSGKGRNLLIGGSGQDSLQGSSGEEILIGGTTIYDNNDLALAAILTEWMAPRRSFKQRTAAPDAGIPHPALGTLFLRRNQSVLEDAARDVLFGNSGSDWFLDLPLDAVCDRRANDR